ncbi:MULTISPECIES: type III secretion system inner membrane ring lipoprotein SctJ [Duganella]|uniref:type III secretion system inner membrane ring lipoprotein SctJ n=1 Tax=Duganella TaxID=75654 RepID=UPI00159D297E
MDILNPHRLSRCLRLACMLALPVMLAACTKMVTLQAGLSDADANDIILVLNRKGIEIEKQKTKEGVTLITKDGDLSRATEAMNAAGLPRRSLSNLGEVFKKQGMISTPMEERIRYIHGLSEELESTLQQFDRVVSARVHVVLPERIAPGEPIQPSSAAVFVKYRPPLDEDAVLPRMRKLVASSIPGLGGDDGRGKVSVVLMPGEPPPVGIQWTMLGPFVVAQDSVGWLTFTLAVLGAMASAGLGYLLFRYAMRSPRVAALVMRLAMRWASRKAVPAPAPEAQP